MIIESHEGPLDAASAARLAGWTSQTGLPPDPALAAGECWLLARETADGAPRAALKLRERLGLKLPRYSYHVGCAVHAAAELDLFCSQATLLLGNDHTGAAELAEIACEPGAEALLPALIEAALARLRASGSRLVVVELAGPRDAAGRAPFWDGLGRHFYPDDPAAAQARFGAAWTSHLAALLPRQMLYLSFLDPAAQAALGRVGAAGEAAAAALAAAGFAAGRHVRIDDGGPIWELALRDPAPAPRSGSA
jgi:arginine N-succinyltransferase